MKPTFFLLASLLLTKVTTAQIAGELDESKLYAQTKQVNQFFRRFNGEEDEKGKRFELGDKQYRSAKLRKNYLEILFDESNSGISRDLKAEFAKRVLDKSNPVILDFHQPGWFCEVKARFNFYGRSVPMNLFMRLEKAQLGRKWVIEKVYGEDFSKLYRRDTSRVGKFLHPMSHELDFMNLRKAFLDRDSITQFASREFVPDQLTLFLYEARKGNLKFEMVEDLNFHFFQVNGWYFELSQFNREGYNTGWLISNLVKLNSEAEKAVMKRHVYHEGH